MLEVAWTVKVCSGMNVKPAILEKILAFSFQLNFMFEDSLWNKLEIT